MVVQQCHPTPGHPRHRPRSRPGPTTAEAIAADLRRGGLRVRAAAGHHGLEAPQAGDEPRQRRRRRLRARRRRRRAASRWPGTRASRCSRPPAIPVRDATEQDHGAPRRHPALRRRGRHRRGGSTWQSVARGTGDVEIDYLSGEVVLLGRLHGVPTPANELLQRVTRELARTGGAVGSLGGRRPAGRAGLSHQRWRRLAMSESSTASTTSLRPLRLRRGANRAKNPSDDRGQDRVSPGVEVVADAVAG